MVLSIYYPSTDKTLTFTDMSQEQVNRTINYLNTLQERYGNVRPKVKVYTNDMQEVSNIA